MLEVLHRAVDLLPHRVCQQAKFLLLDSRVNLTVLRAGSVQPSWALYRSGMHTADSPMRTWSEGGDGSAEAVGMHGGGELQRTFQFLSRPQDSECDGDRKEEAEGLRCDGCVDQAQEEPWT